MAENDLNNSSSNINITPDMINNIVNMLKNNTTTANKASFKNDSFEHISSNDSVNSDNNSENFSNNIDFETILKIKSIMENLNKKDDPRSNLLYSLKPYLRETRQKKLDQYVNLLKITQVTNLFKNDKGDEG